jgi:hypothetical protein
MNTKCVAVLKIETSFDWDFVDRFLRMIKCVNIFEYLEEGIVDCFLCGDG